MITKLVIYVFIQILEHKNYHKNHLWIIIILFNGTIQYLHSIRRYLPKVKSGKLRHGIFWTNWKVHLLKIQMKRNVKNATVVSKNNCFHNKYSIKNAGPHLIFCSSEFQMSRISWRTYAFHRNTGSVRKVSNLPSYLSSERPSYLCGIWA